MMKRGGNFWEEEEGGVDDKAVPVEEGSGEGVGVAMGGADQSISNVMTKEGGRRGGSAASG